MNFHRVWITEMSFKINKPDRLTHLAKRHEKHMDRQKPGKEREGRNGPSAPAAPSTDLAGSALTGEGPEGLWGGISGNYGFPCCKPARSERGEDLGLSQADGEWQPQEAVPPAPWARHQAIKALDPRQRRGVLKRRKSSFQGTLKDYRTTQREGNLCCEPRRGNVDLDHWARCGFRGLLVEPLVSKEQRDLSAWSVTHR